MTDSKGSILFQKFLARKKLSYAKVSAVLGVSKATIGYLANGERAPSLELAVKIEDFAKIRCRDWLRKR